MLICLANRPNKIDENLLTETKHFRNINHLGMVLKFRRLYNGINISRIEKLLNNVQNGKYIVQIISYFLSSNILKKYIRFYFRTGKSWSNTYIQRWDGICMENNMSLTSNITKISKDFVICITYNTRGTHK